MNERTYDAPIYPKMHIERGWHVVFGPKGQIGIYDEDGLLRMVYTKVGDGVDAVWLGTAYTQDDGIGSSR